MEHRPQILTIGHSTHAAERFQALLRDHGIELVCDVRRHPGSRRHPQFDADSLSATLARAGIDYEGMGEQLGGRRATGKSSRSAVFRSYAEHMRTPEFAAGLKRLEHLARERHTAVMCAEGDWRRCHRRLIAEALTTRAWRVTHILPDGRLEEHEPESDARDPRLL